MKVVKIFLVLQVVLSILVSGVGVDVYYHYCGKTGNKHTSFYIKAKCSPDEDVHKAGDCCETNIKNVTNRHTICCHQHTVGEDTGDMLLSNHCTDEYKQYSADLTSTISKDNLKLFIPIECIKTNSLYNNEIAEKDCEAYLRRISPLIYKPKFKLFLYFNMKVFPSEPFISS